MIPDKTLPDTDSQAEHYETTDMTSDVRGVDGHWEKQCLACGEWIGLGPKGSERPFLVHQKNKRCLRTREQKAHKEARETLETLVPSPSTTALPLVPSSSHLTPYPSLAWDPSLSFDDQGILSSGPSPLPHLLAPPVAPTDLAILPTSDPLSTPSPPSPVTFPPLLTPGLSSNDLPTTENPTSSYPSLPAGTSYAPRNDDRVAARLPCNGVEFKWEAGSVFLSYPLQYHDTGNPTWSLDGIGEPGKSHIIRLRSHSCTHFREHSMEACFPCANLVSSPKFQNMLKSASQDPSPNTPYLFLSWKQLEVKLRSTVEELQQERKQNGALCKRIQRMTQKLDDYERLCLHISVSDYKSVNLVLRTALKNGSSPSAMVAKLQLAIERDYTPHPGVDERALDVGYLVKAIGGPRLLFALNRFLSLPSYRTIDRHRTVPQLIPSIFSPTYSEVSENISTFFNLKERPMSSVAGHSLLIDGVALEEKCRWLRSSNSVIGLCREHAGSLDLHVQNPQSITLIQEALNQDEPQAHYASEATVVAIAAFRSSNYSAIPLALSGSCKAETGSEMAHWLKEVVRAWKDSPFGETAHGPIWSIATDGESTMKSCRFHLCMTQTLPDSDPIYPLLKNLTGLNLQTGEDNVTMTCDPKHVFKRFATLLRNCDGILVNRSVVNKNHIRSHLVKLPETDTKMVESLVDPVDKQNVPKAVMLIQLIDKLQTLDTTNYTPSQLNEHRALVAIGAIFSAFMNPFINVNMSLTEQLTSLSKYAHAAFVLYSKHSTGFMTAPLYADSEAITKDTYFCVAKQQALDLMAYYYSLLSGTDRLENNFCLARTQTHHRNFDILDLANKLATSSLIDSIYLRNPDLDTGSRRLKTSGVIGVDHVNPKSWVGDVSVGRVSLQACWEEGRAQAATLISSIYPEDPAPDFNALFREPQHDLLRPEGRYVGVSNQVDLSLGDDISQIPNGPHTPTETVGLPPDLDNISDESDADDGDTNDEQDDGGSEGGNEDGDSDGEGGELEDFLPDSIDEPLDGFRDKAEEWLKIGGQRYHKASLIAQQLKANRSKKVVERTLRVRGLTLEDLRKHPPVAPIGEDNFKVGDLAATLVRTDAAVCLAVFQATAIRKDRSTQHIISMETLTSRDSKYRVEGQVLHLVQGRPDLWAWLPHCFLKVSKPKKGSAHHKSGTQDFTLTVQGPLCYRVNPDISPTSQALPEMDLGSGDPRTWTFHDCHLRDLTEHIWAEFIPENVHPNEIFDEVEALPHIWDLDEFPYKSLSGSGSFTVGGVMLVAPNTVDVNTKRGCPLCGHKMKQKQLRDHVGRHILFRSRGMNERLPREIGVDPCGFCGASGCTTRLIVQGKSRQVKSNCHFYSPFKYGSANKSTRSSPCTNIPIYCPHCKKTIWKYNAVDHIITNHPRLNTVDFDKSFMVNIQIQEQEERCMGVLPELTDAYRNKYSYLFLREEELAVVEREAEQEHEDAKKRSRRTAGDSKNKKRRC